MTVYKSIPNVKENVRGTVIRWSCQIHPCCEMVIRGEKEDDKNFYQYSWEIKNTKGICFAKWESKESYLSIIQCLISAETTVLMDYTCCEDEEKQSDWGDLIETLNYWIERLLKLNRQVL